MCNCCPPPQNDQTTIDAMQALIYEGETEESLIEHFKDKGNEMVADARKFKNKQHYISALIYYLVRVAL